METVENLDLPIGWLIDPHKKWAIHFEQKEDSIKKIKEDFTIDMWGIDSYGKPMEFKSRRKASRKDTLKTWKQLISSNWTKFDVVNIKSA